MQNSNKLAKRTYAQSVSTSIYSTAAGLPIKGYISGTQDYLQGSWVRRIYNGFGASEVINDVRAVFLEHDTPITDPDLVQLYIEGGEVLDASLYQGVPPDLDPDIAQHVYCVIVRVTHPTCARLTVTYTNSIATLRVERGEIWTSLNAPFKVPASTNGSYLPLGVNGNSCFMQIKLGNMMNIEPLQALPLFTAEYSTEEVSQDIIWRYCVALKLFPEVALSVKISYSYLQVRNFIIYTQYIFRFEDNTISPASLSNRTHVLQIPLIGSSPDDVKQDCEFRLWEDTEIWELSGTPSFLLTEPVAPTSIASLGFIESIANPSLSAKWKMNSFEFGNEDFPQQYIAQELNVSKEFGYFEIHAFGFINTTCTSIPGTNMDFSPPEVQYAWQWIATTTPSDGNYFGDSAIDATPFRLFGTYSYTPATLNISQTIDYKDSIAIVSGNKVQIM